MLDRDWNPVKYRELFEKKPAPKHGLRFPFQYDNDLTTHQHKSHYPWRSWLTIAPNPTWQSLRGPAMSNAWSLLNWDQTTQFVLSFEMATVSDWVIIVQWFPNVLWQAPLWEWKKKIVPPTPPRSTNIETCSHMTYCCNSTFNKENQHELQQSLF